ncbi:MAG: ATP-binding protein [Burkholderiaceae bacterium]
MSAFSRPVELATLIHSLREHTEPTLVSCCEMAATLCESDMSLVSLVDGTTQWVVASHGLTLKELPQRGTLCDLVVSDPRLHEVPDITVTEGYEKNALFIQFPTLRHYAAVPLVVDGQVIGAFSVLDHASHQLTPEQREALERLGQIAAGLLEKRSAQLRASQSQARLNKMSRLSVDQFWEIDADQLVTWSTANVDANAMQGWQLQIGQKLPTALVCDSSGRPIKPAQQMTDLLRERQHLDPTLIQLETPEGPNWLQVSVEPLLDKHGRQTGLRGRVSALLEMVSRQKHETDRDILLAQVARHVPGFFFQLEAASLEESNVSFVSDGVLKLCELKPADIRRDFQLFVEKIHRHDIHRVIRSLERSAGSMKPWKDEFRLVVAGKEIRHLVGYAMPKPANNRMIAWYGFITDATELKQLQQDKTAAEQASAVKTEFMSRVNHELRTPLNGVLGFAQLMMSDPVFPLAETQRERLSHIETAGLRLLDLIDNMLNLTRLEQRDNWIQRQEVDLTTVVEECTALGRSLAHDKGVTLSLTTLTGGGTVMADAHALAQVLGHLLSNALNYSPRDSTVHVVVQDIDNRYCVSIIDRGCGISQDKIKQLFQPFNRLGAENTTTAKGVGLGLSVSQALAEAMGGRITVKSTPGKGSCFRLHLEKAADRSKIESEQLVPKSGLAATGSLPQAPSAGATADGEALIVYAEDDRLNAVLITDALQRRNGFKVIHLENGRLALDFLIERRPDILLADINMPEMDGYELISAVRSHPTLFNLTCVAISADAAPEQVQAGLDAGFDAYWPKPIDLSQLTLRVERLLTRDEPLLPVDLAEVSDASD